MLALAVPPLEGGEGGGGDGGERAPGDDGASLASFFVASESCQLVLLDVNPWEIFTKPVRVARFLSGRADCAAVGRLPASPAHAVEN